MDESRHRRQARRIWVIGLGLWVGACARGEQIAPGSSVQLASRSTEASVCAARLQRLSDRAARQARQLSELEGRLAMLEVSLGEVHGQLTAEEPWPGPSEAALAEENAAADAGIWPQGQADGQARPLLRVHGTPQGASATQPASQPPEAPVVSERLPVTHSISEPSLASARAAAGPSVQDVKRARSRYRVALRLIRERRLDEALQALDRFVTDYAGHPLAGNATLWLGRVRFARKQYRAAVRHFRHLLERFEGHDSAAEALYAMALCYQRLGHERRATRVLRRLRREFPDSSAARRLSEARPAKEGMS